MAKTKKISVSMDDDLLKWLESQKKKKRFASRSHGIRYCVEQEKNKEEGK